MSLISIRRKGQVADKPKVVVNNPYDADDALALSPEVVNTQTVDKDGNIKTEVQLSEWGNKFSGTSIEEALKHGWGSTTKYWDYYKSTGVLRKCINMIANFTTRAGFETTISCINKDDDPTKPEYLAVKQEIDDLNRQVNLDYVIFVTQIKRHLHGCAGWQWVTDKRTKKILALHPLTSSYINPVVDDNGFYTGMTYHPSPQQFIPKENSLFFNIDSLNNNSAALRGVSSVRSIERNIRIKKNLERDLLYASRSLWAPIIIYEADTRGLTPTEKDELFDNLKEDLKPGAIIVTNKAVTPHVIQYNPNLGEIIRACEMQDTEIIGNFGIPKALLSREKTVARATLEFSIRGFYESSIAGEQTYLKRQLERQWYDPLVKSMGYGDKIRIRHEWRPILDPESDLIIALVRAYDKGVISGDEFFRRLGWELDRVPEEPTPPSKEAKNE